MKLNVMSFLVFLTLCFSLHAQTEELSTSHVGFEKIYVQPEQILMTQDGIYFLNNEGHLERTCALLSDSQGLYAIKQYYICPGCGWANDDGKCINTRCPLFGR
jgi:hypothetical protein